MTADKHFNRWMRRAGVVFLLVLAYVLMADMAIPMTPHAMVQRPVLTIAPRVAGEVVEVDVTNNQAVKAGDLLFRIDPSDYQLAVQKAELALREAQQTNDNLKAQLAQADAAITEAKAEDLEKRRELKRLRALHQRKLVSQQQVDQAATDVDAAAAQLLAAQEKRRAIAIDLGGEGDQNLRLQQAQNQLDQARLDLSRTEVRAPEDGVVSNLQLVSGIQAQAKQSLLSLVVTGRERIAADFREKTLKDVAADAPAWVVFDALPGKVFPAVLSSRDLGVAKGQLSPNGQLAQPDDSDRWVRDAQRIRIYVKLDDNKLPQSLVTGSRATVMLTGTDSGLLRWVGKLQMNIVSLLHYVY
ncbi:MAG: HlyD family secretion protein [Pseudomonadota bacterium]|uniref:Multidrug resistance efflux pump n=1 Tax=Gallaecimonas pentaromativorans TaxID=584787 RepID=A0A3N1PNY6_9GAMM|nr:HlyD family secretion protein [Gallaecimonas pentaromativorans]MED5524697.1 HlyD family secretion protein [Pseudomonadota bacterium]ROQ28687.1 multidrug resistance efflux pump [Gallaecimonas pentaromativorans]